MCVCDLYIYTQRECIYIYIMHVISNRLMTYVTHQHDKIRDLCICICLRSNIHLNK